MATILKAETEEKLSRLAERTHRPKDELVDEAVNQLLAYNDWFESKVKGSIAAAKRGEILGDEEVLAWIEKRERAE
jgi:predicted transcriptional regulator